MFKKLSAALLAAAIAVTSATCAFAEIPAETIETAAAAAVVQQNTAAATVWDGTSALKAGKSYTVNKNITISKSVTVPAGTTLTITSKAKLTIGAKGSLLIKGTVNVKSGGTLAVSGKLTLYKGKKLTVSGAMKLTKTAVVSLSGKFTVKSTGTVSGTGKKVTVGKTAVCTIDGKNSCAKLTAALPDDKAADTAAIKKTVQSFMDTAFVKCDFMGATISMMPEAYADELLNGTYTDEDGTEKPNSEMLDQLSMLMLMVMSMTYPELDMANLVSCDMTDFKVTYTDPAEITVTDKAAPYYKNLTDAADITYSYSIKDADGTVTEPTEATMSLVKMDGKWYQSPEETSEI